MKLVSLNTNMSPCRAKFQVSPKMTKTEIKDYLKKIYSMFMRFAVLLPSYDLFFCSSLDIPVIKVDTALLLGRWKRLYSKRRVLSYKRRNVKEAFVQFTKPTFSADSPLKSNISNA